MAAYLTLAEFKDGTPMPSEDVDELEVRAAGFVAKRLEFWSGWLDARLRKRYEAPFAAPAPPIVLAWLTSLVTVDCYTKRGCNPQDQTITDIVGDRDRALAEVKEAADSKDGLFDLPLRGNTTTTGITLGGPLGYSETSPYVWADLQAEAGRGEDSSGSGT